MTGQEAEAPTPWASGGEVSLRDLFVGFLRIGLFGFGGVASVARHEIVERRRWLNDREYAGLLGVSKVLPGANTVNAGVMIGDRFQGPLGAVAAVVAIMAMPVVIAVLLTLGYRHVAALPWARAMMAGAAAAAAGLVIGTGLKMARAIRPSPAAIVFGAVTVAAVAVLQVGLLTAVLVLAPLAALVFALQGRAGAR